MLLKLSSKGQLVLPKLLREKLHIKNGDHFQVRIVNDTIVLEPVQAGLIDKLFGKFAGHDYLSDLETEHKQETENG